MKMRLKYFINFCLICSFSFLLCGCSGNEESAYSETEMQNIQQLPNNNYFVPPYSNNTIDNYNWGADKSNNTTMRIRCSTCRETGNCPQCNGTGRTYRTRYSGRLWKREHFIPRASSMRTL